MDYTIYVAKTTFSHNEAQVKSNNELAIELNSIESSLLDKRKKSSSCSFVF